MKDMICAEYINGFITFEKEIDTLMVQLKDVNLATSDSAVIDKSDSGIFDMAGKILTEKFKANLPDLRLIG